MERGNSLRKYRAVDCLIWCLMLVLFETVTAKAGAFWFREQPWTVSLVPPLTLIMYMRWSLLGLPYSALGGFVLSSALSGGAGSALTYVLGNLLSVLVYPVMKLLGKERIASSFFLSAFAAVLTTVLMQTGRGLVSLIAGGSPAAFSDFYTTDALSAVFAVLIVGIVRKRDGVFEDQITYLERLNREEEEKKNEGNSF